MNVACYTIYKGLLNNKLFEVVEDLKFNKDSSERYIALKRFLEAKNIQINTYDCYDEIKKIDVWLFIDPPYDIYKFIIKNRIGFKKSIMFLIEPPVGNPKFYKYIYIYFMLFKAVLTWNERYLKKGSKFFKFNFPITIEANKYNYYKNLNKRNLCLMMHSNRTSSVPGELYSLRRKLIRYFEDRGDKLLDLYGFGWNDDKSPNPFFSTLYQGTILDKRQTYAKYYFSFCLDNSILPGYITYDPFISMASGTVPIYYPMPDAYNYIPENTFIDFSKYESWDNLVLDLKKIVKTGRYEEYRKNGWEFINSEKFEPFTINRFCNDVYKAILKVKE